jgi:hypothetical protein
VMLAHVREMPDPPSTRADVPSDIERVVLKCLEKDALDRYQSARDLDAALAACGDSLATTSERQYAAGVARMPRVR